MQKRFTNQEIRAWAGRREGSHVHESAALSQHEQLNRLLSADISLVQEGDAEDTSPLHYACAVGDVHTVALLIKHGADVNAGNFHRETPLLWSLIEADRSKRLEKVKLLVQAGADLNAPNVEGETIAHQGFRDPELMHYLLKHGAHVHATNMYDWTPLHYAVLFSECVQSVAYLLQFQADVNAPDDEQYTPLHLAVKHANIHAIQLLLNAGADIEAKTIEGKTPYTIAQDEQLSEHIKKALC